MKQLIPIRQVPKTVTKSEAIPTNCFEILIVNKGTATALIDGFPLEANKFLAIPCNEGCIRIAPLNIKFLSGTKRLDMLMNIPEKEFLVIKGKEIYAVTN